MPKKSVLIMLDKPRNIRLGTNELAQLEDLLEKPLSAMDGKSFGIRETRAILWVGLQHESKDLSLIDVGNLMDEVDLLYVADKVGEAVQIALGIKPGDLVAKDPNG